LAAWIVEKWRTWSDCGGDIESRFSKDELLTHLTIYWATNTISSSVRLYYESGRAPSALSTDNKVSVPTSFARFPVEINYPPEEWIKRYYNLVRYTRMPSGGHFAAAEEPELLAQDIRESFRSLR
jgi:pimeloyl-ACP methyl ester carboxylesterase